MTKTAFFVGLGFIGGTVFSHLRSARPDIQVKALVRREEQVSKLRELGVEPVRGTLDDAATIASTVADPKVEIVLHMATADHVPSAVAIIEGLKARPKDAPKAVYIHTSGTGELVDDSHGAFEAKEDYMFHDGTAAGLDDRLQPQAPHRDVDLEIRKLIANAQAEKEFNVRVGIILPPLIYGIGSGPFNQLSIQIPTYIRTAVALNRGVFIGGGKGVWNAIHVQHLATAYLTLLAHLESTPPGKENNPYYIAETQVFHWHDLVSTIARKLHALGKLPSADVSPLKDEEWSKFPVPPAVAWGTFADNSLATSEHLPAIGWKRENSWPNVLDSIEQTEVEEVLKRTN